MSVTVVLGAQWGNEGTGKLISVLAKDHSIIIGKQKHILHLLASELLSEGTTCIVGNGAHYLEMASTIKKSFKPVGIDIKQAIADGTNVLIGCETQPYITAAHTLVRGICSNIGVSPRSISNTIGVVKAYTTQVGTGPFVTELHSTLGDQIRKRGNEFKPSNGQPRRCGWLDLVQMKHSMLANGLTQINLTKLDVLTGIGPLKICTAYGTPNDAADLYGETFKHYPARHEDLAKVQPFYQEFKGWNKDITNVRSFNELPKAAQKYVKFIEKTLGVPVTSIGVGPKNNQIIFT